MGVGRPTKDIKKDKSIMLRLTEEEFNTLSLIATQNNTSKSNVLLKGIEIQAKKLSRK